MSEAKHHGILLINKPKGISSHGVVAKVRRELGQKKVGHAGTLDPLAEGLLVLLLGEATKLSDHFINYGKTYVTEVTFGQVSDTWDSEGPIHSTEEAPTHENISKAYSALETGDLQLPVPAFSAVKVGGQKLYQKARRGESFDLPIRSMGLEKSEILDSSINILKAFLKVKKGFYVRSWAYQLGVEAKCGAFMSSLVRTSVGPYLLDHAVSLEELSVDKLATAAFIPFQSLFTEAPVIRCDGRDSHLLINGQVPFAIEKRLNCEMRLTFSDHQSRFAQVISKNPPFYGVLQTQKQGRPKISNMIKH